MRFIHTADWHLGRIFHGVHLTGDQAYILDDFLRLVKDSKVDAVIIAGDIYDRSVPPASAVQLLDEVLTKLVVELDIAVIMIAGNHDSPQRLGFGADLMSDRKLFLSGTLKNKQDPILLSDRYGWVSFTLTPFTEPSQVRTLLSDPEIKDHNSAAARLLPHLKAPEFSELRSVLISHAHVEGGRISESERPLSVWDSGRVKIDVYRDFDYVALGHLHLPQSLGDGRIHYSGSLLKYSFGEANDKKVVNLVEMNSKGHCRIEPLSLRARRDVRCIEGCLNELLEQAEGHPWREDYLKITLLDKGPILDAMGKLRTAYPNVLHIERPRLALPEQTPSPEAHHQTMSEAELFSSFFSEVTGEELSVGELKAYGSVMSQAQKRDRESV